MRVKDYSYTNSEMEHIISEYIHSQRDRQILKLCFVDGITHEKIAEVVDLTPRQVSNIISKGSIIIAEQLERRVYVEDNSNVHAEIHGEFGYSY